MVNIFKKIIEWFRPPKDEGTQKPPENDKGNDGTCKSQQINIAYLNNEIVRQFKDEMNRLSVNAYGNYLILYPMSFNIIMNKEDYSLIGEAIPFSLSIVVLGFYNAIKEKIEEAEKKGETYSYTPPATTWFFQWAESACKETNGQAQPLQSGEIFINSSLTKVEVTNDNIETIQNTGSTSRVVNSNTKQTNNNPDALGGATISTSNTSEWTFDSELPTNINVIRETLRDKQNALAILSYVDGMETKRYSMLDQKISISGSMDKRKISNLFVINNDKVKNDIIRIQYLKKENKFQICAYGDVRVNERRLPISESNTYNWQDISYISEIFLPDVGIQISFKASDAIINRA